MRSESLRTDQEWHTVGIYDRDLPGPMRVNLLLDGEMILLADYELGFLRRSVERYIAGQNWLTAIPFVDRIDPEHSAFSELVYCLAVEELADYQVDERTQNIRLLITELNRIASHLKYISLVARSVGAETMMHFALRDREKLLDLFELLSGSRFNLNYMRVGGVSHDVSEGFLERVISTCDLLRVRIKEYNDLFTFSDIFRGRAVGVGCIQNEDVKSFNLTGPNARACGIKHDIRKAKPYSGTERVDFGVPVSKGQHGIVGDCLERFLLRLHEIVESIEITMQLVDRLGFGTSISKPFDIEETIIVPEGESFKQIESPRGALGCYICSDGGTSPSRIQWRSPSQGGFQVLKNILPGSRFSDFSLIMASLQLSVAEVDR